MRRFSRPHRSDPRINTRFPARVALFAAFVATWAIAVAPQAAGALEGSYDPVTTRIAVKLDERLSSQDSKTGDVFAFELTGSVIVEGSPMGTGTRGHGVIVEAHSGEGPKHGVLRLEARSLDLADGRHIPVGLAPGSLDRTLARESRGLFVPLGGAVPVYLGPSRDNNVVYAKGTPFFVVAPPPATPEPEASR